MKVGVFVLMLLIKANALNTSSNILHNTIGSLGRQAVGEREEQAPVCLVAHPVFPTGQVGQAVE